MQFLNITILLNEKVRTCKQRHCSNHALLWVATKLKHIFTDFLFTKFSKCSNLSTFPCLSPLQSSLSSSTSLFQCHTHKTLTPRQQRLGFNPFSGTPTFGHLPCQIILTVSTSPQAAVSEVSGIEWTWHPWKRIEGKYAQGHCHAKLTEAGCVKRGNFDPRQIAMTTLLHFFG